MRYYLIFLFSINAFAAARLDEAVHFFSNINEENTTIDFCMEDISVNECELKSEVDTNILEQYKKCPSTPYNKDVFEKFLSEDQTSEFTYVLDSKSPDWYVCQHFSTQSFMRGSCFANQDYTDAYEESTNIVIQNEETKLKNQQPIFYVSIASPSNNFYHAINAVFIGETIEDMQDINNYILYEPQSDKLYYSISDFRSDWEKYKLPTATDLEFKISVMDKPGYTSNGSLQFITKGLVEFKCPLPKN